jgi:multicomponent Na+:H+ antiporter subunit D
MSGIETFIHPSLAFFVLALAMPFLSPGQHGVWRWLLPVPPIIAIALVLTMPGGIHGEVGYLGMKLVFGRVDRLSIVFAHIFAIQALLGMIFSMHVDDRGQHAAALCYVGGALGCVFAGDYVTLFIFWELMSVASTFLVWLRRTEKSTAAGFRYFLFHTAGGLFLLAGMLLRYQALGTFAFTPVNPALANFYDWLILVGFCVNAAVVPLHAWLPDAYPEATVTGAVFMSAFTTKTAVYVLARGFAGFEILAVMGVVMTIYGAAFATIENNARRILSYHIVSQVGYMVAGIGIGTAMTVNGACAHAYAHILYKGLLFMAAGCVLYSTGTAKLTELGGLAYRLPWVMFFYMVAAVSISGWPLFNGFISKTMTITGAAEAHHTWLALGMEVAAVGTFLSVGIKLPYFAFFYKSDYAKPVKPIPINMTVAMAGAAFLCFFIGVVPGFLYRLLPYPVEYVPYTAWHVTQALILLSFTGLGFYLTRKIIVPKAKIVLDFDFFYRLFGHVGLIIAKWPLAWADNFWTNVYKRLGLAGMLKSAGACRAFDEKAIDGVVDGSARSMLGAGGRFARLETGKLADYIGLALLLGAGIFVGYYFIFGI